MLSCGLQENRKLVIKYQFLDQVTSLIATTSSVKMYIQKLTQEVKE